MKREYEKSVARDTRNPFLRWIITQCHHLCVNNIMAQIVFIISVVVAKRESCKIMFENQTRNYDNCKCKNTHTSQCHQAIKMQQFENCLYRCLNIVSNKQAYRCQQQNKFLFMYINWEHQTKRKFVILENQDAFNRLATNIININLSFQPCVHFRIKQ